MRFIVSNYLHNHLYIYIYINFRSLLDTSIYSDQAMIQPIVYLRNKYTHTYVYCFCKIRVCLSFRNDNADKRALVLEIVLFGCKNETKAMGKMQAGWTKSNS